MLPCIFIHYIQNLEIFQHYHKQNACFEAEKKTSTFALVFFLTSTLFLVSYFVIFTLAFWPFPFSSRL